MSAPDHPDREELELLHYDGLEAGRRDEVARHAASCRECAGVLGSLEAEARLVARALDEAPVSPPPPAVLEPAPAAPFARRLLGPALLAAGLLLAIGLSLRPVAPPAPPPEPPGSPAPAVEPLAFLAAVASGPGEGRTWRTDESVRVDVEERTEFLLGDGSFLEARPGSRIVLGPAIGGRPRIALERGALYVDVARRDGPFAIETDAGRVQALGTRFEVEAADQVQVRVWQGLVELTTSGGSVLGQGGEVLTSGSGHGPGKRVPGGVAGSWRFPVEARAGGVEPGPLWPWRFAWSDGRPILVGRLFGRTDRGLIRGNRTVVLAESDRGDWLTIADVPGKAPLDLRAAGAGLSFLAMDFATGALEVLEIALPGGDVRARPLPPLDEPATWARWAWDGDRAIVVAGGPGALRAREVSRSSDGGRTWTAFEPLDHPAGPGRDEEADLAILAAGGRFRILPLERGGDRFDAIASDDGARWASEPVEIPVEDRPARLWQVETEAGSVRYFAEGPRGAFVLEVDAGGASSRIAIPGASPIRRVAGSRGDSILVLEDRSTSHHLAHVTNDGGTTWSTGLLSESVSGRVGFALSAFVAPGGRALAAFHRARSLEPGPGHHGVRTESTHLLVRSWAAGPATPPDLAADRRRAIERTRELGSVEYAVREAAEAELRAMGARARAAVEAATRSDDLEVRTRARRLLPRLGEPWWIEEER